MAWLRLSLLALVACKQEPRIVIDGAWREPAWNAKAQRGVFVDETGSAARPYSEIRLLREGDQLYVALYAADEDIRSDDAFELRVGITSLRITPNEARRPRLAVSLDGTLDRPSDDDEEWIVELALPVASPITASRCDQPKSGGQRCGRWSGAIQDLGERTP